MSKIINPNGYVEEEKSIEGAAARSPVFTQDLSGAKVDPQGNIYKEQDVGGITGRMPVVVLESDEESGTVTSVNGYTGEVTLNAADVGAAKVSDLINADWNAASGLAEIKNKPTTFPPSINPQVDWSSFLNTQNNVGFLRAYNNTPAGNNTTFFGFGVTYDNSADFGAQFSMRNNKAYFRTKESGVIGSWNEFWHNGNLHYEEGDWTPFIYINNSISGITYSNQHGRYTIIGNHITCFCTITLTSKGSNTGAVEIRGFPLPIGVDYGVPSFRVTNTNISGQLTGYNNYTNPSNQIILEQIINGTAVRLTNVDLNNNSLISFTLTYFI